MGLQGYRVKGLQALLHVRPDMQRVRVLLVRYWYEYRQLWKAQIMRDFLDRLLFLLAFGFGLGGVMAAHHGGNYFAFLIPGIAASNGVFVMTIAMTFGVWERAFSNRIWLAWMATPVKLPDILLAELIYAALRVMPSIVMLLLLGALWLHAIPILGGALLALPILFVANMALGVVALCVTAHVRRTLHFAYVNTLWTTPMFLFSGVFFDLHQAHPAMFWVAQFFPLTHIVALVRPLMMGTPLNPWVALGDAVALVLMLVLGYVYAVRAFERRLLR